MKKLLIIGTGGFAREVYSHMQGSVGYGTEFCFKGFLEAGLPFRPNEYKLMPANVLNDIDNYACKDEDVFILAMANSERKKRIAKFIESKGGSFINLIHKTAIIAESAKLGVGNIICPNTFISCNTVIGDHVMLNLFSSIGHDAKLGSFSSVMGHVDITGGVVAGEGTYWGSGSRALPGSKVGDYAKVGAGSLVLKKVKAGHTVFGIPAMPI